MVNSCIGRDCKTTGMKTEGSDWQSNKAQARALFRDKGTKLWEWQIITGR